jgi:hypothetical protein
MRVGGIAAAIAVLAGATVGGAMLIRDVKQESNAAPQPPASAASAVVPNENKNPPADSQASQQPAPPPPPPSSAAVTPPPSSAVPPTMPPNASVVDFSTTPDGQAAGDRFISGDAYAASGVKLSTVIEKAPPACKDATVVALRTRTDYGAFLSSARQVAVDLCNNQPVRFTFLNPTTSVRLNFSGPKGTEYTMQVQLSNGTVVPIKAPAQDKGLITQTQPYTAPTGVQIKWVTFDSSNQEATNADPTVIKGISFAS